MLNLLCRGGTIFNKRGGNKAKMQRFLKTRQCQIQGGDRERGEI